MSRFTRLTPTLFCELDALSRTFAGRPIIVEWAAFRCRACRLWEISENLHRAELTALERDKLVAEWVELTGESQVPQNGAARPQYEKRGIREAARQLPVSGDTEKAREHQIARSLKVASLSPEAQDAAREVGLDDNRTALLEAAKQPTAVGAGIVLAPSNSTPTSPRSIFCRPRRRRRGRGSLPPRITMPAKQSGKIYPNRLPKAAPAISQPLKSACPGRPWTPPPGLLRTASQPRRSNGGGGKSRTKQTGWSKMTNSPKTQKPRRFRVATVGTNYRRKRWSRRW